jgi:hypothetical protein
MIRVANSFSIQNVNMTILDVAVFLSQAVTDKVTAVLLPPCRCQGGEDVLFLLILDLSTRWGRVVSIMPIPSSSYHLVNSTKYEVPH